MQLVPRKFAPLRSPHRPRSPPSRSYRCSLPPMHKQAYLIMEGGMRRKLLPIVWLVSVALGCKDRAKDVGTVPDSTSTSDSARTLESDTTSNRAEAGKAAILSVTLHVRTVAGKVGDLQVELNQQDKEKGIDALFFSQEAVRKFVVPYYTIAAGEGRDSAAAIQTSVAQQARAKGIVVVLHKLKSKVLIPRDYEEGVFPLRFDVNSGQFVR
jgi:hypothetical protein